ncbi:hypothetical protein HMPREF0240_01238 [Clostridium sp. D5]|nr:hypothetical protein HMPREF0240_01238 [Clostridium sp. D5]
MGHLFYNYIREKGGGCRMFIAPLDVQLDCDDKTMVPCPMMEKGQVFYADYAKPEGFCDEARKAICQYVLALSHGAGKEVFYYGDRIRKPGAAICSCNDGLRPVIFKIEALPDTP